MINIIIEYQLIGIIEIYFSKIAANNQQCRKGIAEKVLINRSISKASCKFSSFNYIH